MDRVRPSPTVYWLDCPSRSEISTGEAEMGHKNISQLPNCEQKVGQEAQLLMAAAKPTAGSPAEKRCPLHPFHPVIFGLVT